jgi:hypothetical protein
MKGEPMQSISTECHDRPHYGTDMPLPCIGLIPPWFQVGRLPAATIGKPAAMDHPWDPDLQLKPALGLPARVLEKAHRLLCRTS